ncbi:MAG: hypothetical protein HYX94_02805 [Chloroflexi bacterium]|nr:hypothetical protein [Chloroflexota bacterium]
MEEKAELLAPGNTEMRSILAEALAILRDSKEARTIGVSTEKTLDMVLASLIDENAALRRSLYQAIETLYRWESKLDGERLAALRSRIRKYLRRQLDQDLAVYRPVRAGRMAKGA